VSRQQRQRDELVAVLADGDVVRTTVLVREHLLEFPTDAVVRLAIADLLASGRVPEREGAVLRALLADAGSADAAGPSGLDR
jgi:hypothetical protein